MRACAYLRTDHEDPVVMATLRELVAEKAAEQEVPVQRWYEDAGVPGDTPLQERPAADEMLMDIEGGVYDTVVVLTSRSLGSDLTTLGDTVSLINFAGGHVRILAEPPPSEGGGFDVPLF